jgi:uncharacterized protein (DUF362 family)
MSKVAKVKFVDYQSSVAAALDLIGAAGRLPAGGMIIIKPNLTSADAPPVTTNVRAAEAVYKYCKARCGAEIAIGEGCGDGTTERTFRANGYSKLAQRCGIRLIDFNSEEALLVRNENALHWKEFHIPKIVRKAFVVSLPVLKGHSFTRTTIAMKNMFGIAPAAYYGGSWNKSKLHSPSAHKSVFDVCLYRKPDLCVVDAAVAMRGSHLSGRHDNMGLILAGFDPVAVDAVGSELLGQDPSGIEYLRLANGLLGSMDDIEILEE